MKKPVVHIVHHVDTEGPMCEPLSELFTRVGQTLGVELDFLPTQQNLELLQSASCVFKDKETDMLLKKIIDPALLSFNKSWYEVEEMLDRILSAEYRNEFKDSFGNGWIYNWHLLDHVGFTTNPRRRELGYSGVFNFFLDKLKATKSDQDSTQWHFHPVPFNKAANISATSYLNSTYELSQVVCRRLIDANWFPVVNRAGFHTVRPDSNWWLEQWLPFDASNQSLQNDNTAFADNINGRFGDWRGAPDDWSLYNPDLYDWRKKGSLKRTIARCLNMNTRFRNISVQEFKKAFELAKSTEKDVYVGFTNHDFREMSTEIELVHGMLSEAAKDYPEVDHKFSDTISAFRACIGYDNEEISKEKLQLSAELSGTTLKVKVENGDLFGSQPFIAIKTVSNTYHTDNFDFGEPDSKEFYYTFDYLTFNLEQLKTVKVAANDKYGNTSIVTVNL
ncbi:MAG: hypothetical protein H7321_04445 [Bacteroidia bacterium]|nr:hypothetical protein [Bacteroidia bacterium]